MGRKGWLRITAITSPAIASASSTPTSVWLVVPITATVCLPQRPSPDNRSPSWRTS